MVAFRLLLFSLYSLSLGQERSGILVDRNKQALPRAHGLLRCALPGIYVQVSQGLRDRGFLRTSAITPRVPRQLTICVQFLNRVDEEIHLNLAALDGTGETVLRVILWQVPFLSIYLCGGG